MSLFLLSDLDTDSSGSSRHLRSLDYFAGAEYLGLKGQFHVVLDSLYYVDLWKKDCLFRLKTEGLKFTASIEWLFCTCSSINVNLGLCTVIGHNLFSSKQGYYRFEISVYIIFSLSFQCSVVLVYTLAFLVAAFFMFYSFICIIVYDFEFFYSLFLF